MPQTPEHPIEKPGPEETLEFLKRQEVRTMAKDVALLREQEAKKERGRISSLKPETKASQPQPGEPVEPRVPSLMPGSVSTSLPASPQSQSEPTSSADRPSISSISKEAPKEPRFKFPIPKRPAHFDKVFIRVVLILGASFIMVNIAAFAVWRSQKGATSPPPPVQETIPTPSQAPQEPLSLLPLENTRVLEITHIGQIPVSLSQFFQQHSQEGLTRILFKNNADNRFLSLQEVLQALNVSLAPQLEDQLEEESTLFLSVSGELKRIGFVSELKDSREVLGLLSGQEKTFEQDTAPLLSVIGRKGLGYTTLFRTTVYKGVEVRFQTFSVRDFGICYAIVDSKLIFTTSLRDMRQAVDLLLATP